MLANSKLSLLTFPVKHNSLELAGVGVAKSMYKEIQNHQFREISRGQIINQVMRINFVTHF